VPLLRFDEVGVVDIESSIQSDIRPEVDRVGQLSRTWFGLVGIVDVGSFIFVSVASKSVHKNRANIADPVHISESNSDCLNVAEVTC
jgi:hypothetical protein